LKISAKKVVFLISSEKKQISPLLALPRKILENSLVAPVENIHPTPMVVSYKNYQLADGLA